METYEKVSDTVMKIVIPQPSKVEEVHIDDLASRLRDAQNALADVETNYLAQKTNLQGQIDTLTAQIAQAASLGIKPTTGL